MLKPLHRQVLKEARAPKSYGHSDTRGSRGSGQRVCFLGKATRQSLIGTAKAVHLEKRLGPQHSPRAMEGSSRAGVLTASKGAEACFPTSRLRTDQACGTSHQQKVRRICGFQDHSKSRTTQASWEQVCPPAVSRQSQNVPYIRHLVCHPEAASLLGTITIRYIGLSTGLSGRGARGAPTYPQYHQRGGKGRDSKVTDLSLHTRVTVLGRAWPRLQPWYWPHIMLGVSGPQEP